jgi:hypothetical protein
MKKLGSYIIIKRKKILEIENMIGDADAGTGEELISMDRLPGEELVIAKIRHCLPKIELWSLRLLRIYFTGGEKKW